ncbi:EpsG family protein [Sphingobacterium sp.]|uniref:EpsG family protein n=1 Tax=Sphingobacterium sp. TaxID=341027 RepID=UPI0025893785|nr:EpsG family protein [Sphingobacterium sp.]WET70814.1 MAG: EpsG family protein [Sphingobacterium sp.]
MVYLLLSILLLIFTLAYDLKIAKTGKDFWYWSFFVCFTALSGFRYKVGGDTLEYFNSFTNQIPTLKSLNITHFETIRYEPFWILLNSFCKTIIDDFAFFQIVHAIFINVVIFRFFKKNTQYLFTAILIYWLFFYLYFNMEILRESIAISFFLLAYPYLSTKRLGKFYILVFCAIMFHASAVFLCFLPLFKNAVLNKGTMLKIGFLVFGIILLLGVLPNLMPNTEIQRRLAIYQLFTPSFFGFTFYAMIFFGGPMYIYINYIKYRRPIFKDIIVVYFSIAAIVSYLTGFSRLINYFMPFLSIYFVNYLFLVYNLRRYRKIKAIFIPLIVVIAFFPKYLYYFRDTSDLVPDTHNYNRWFPYCSIFDKQENKERELLFYRSFNDSREYIKNKNKD